MKSKLGFSLGVNAVLMGLHIGFFVLAMILRYTLATSEEDHWIHLLCAPRDGGVLLQQPWSAITHLFLHLHPLHLLFNLGVLSILLSPLLWHLGTKPVWIAFFAGGLSGYLAFCVVPSLGGSTVNYITGSSAALTSLICTGWTMRPQLKIKITGSFFLDLKWLALLILSIDLWMIAGGKDMGTHSAHIGGAIFGIVYGFTLSYSSNTHRAGKVRGRPKTDDEFNAERATKRQRVDALLDKISRSGYDSLTSAEKDYLERNAKDI